jgi:DNA-binding beta-propeller fold protein YncE
MKKNIPSNWRSHSCALSAFLIVIAALSAMPRNARAQLYVTQMQGSIGGIVSKYNATTGAPINAKFITGLHGPFLGLVLNTSGRRLFVANSSNLTNSVGQYNATTGAPINARFITGLNAPVGLAVMGPTPLFSEPTLFVANGGNNTVGKYDARTGAAINPDFITTGLHAPTGLALLGNTLFVANFNTGTVGAYDATTGAAINVNFIAGLDTPQGLALLGNTLSVANEQAGTVGKYDATTGAAIAATFITGLTDPIGIAVK